MAKESVNQELIAIKDSLKELTSKLDSKPYSVTAGSEDDYRAYTETSGTGKEKHNIVKDYSQMLIDSAIAKSELGFEQKINTVQKEILSEMNGLSNSIKENKPNYFIVFISIFFASVLTLAAIFVPIIPIYTENIINGKKEEIKTSVIVEIQKYIDKQLIEKLDKKK